MNLTPSTVESGTTPTAASAHVLAEVVRAFAANRRTARAHTLNRGEVSGGGRKPWRQKGTGRARAGLTRSPLWRTGGTVFGPRSTRNYTLGLPAKLRTRALAIALTLRADAKSVFEVDALPTDGKTKSLASERRETTLLVLAAPNAELTRAGRNLGYLTIKLASQVNAEDVLRASRVVGTSDALKILTERVKAPATAVPVKKTTRTKRTRPSAKAPRSADGAGE